MILKNVNLFKKVNINIGTNNVWQTSNVLRSYLERSLHHQKRHRLRLRRNNKKLKNHVHDISIGLYYFLRVIENHGYRKAIERRLHKSLFYTE